MNAELILATLEVNVDAELQVIREEITPLILSHRTRVKRYLDYGTNLIASVNTGEMNSEKDELIKKYIIAGKTLETDLKENRSIVTKSMDLAKKQFTDVENLLSITKTDTIVYECQQIRNRYAQAIVEAEKKRQAEIARKQAKDAECIELKKTIELQFSIHFNSYVAAKKSIFNEKFNKITLETFEKESSWFINTPFAYDINHFNSFKWNVINNYHNDSEFNQILHSVLDVAYTTSCNAYVAELNELRSLLVDNLQSKKNELQSIRDFEIEEQKQKQVAEQLRLEALAADSARQAEIAKHQAENNRLATERQAEQTRINNERIARETAERNQAAAIAAEKQKQAEQAIETKAQVATTVSMFDSVVQSTEAPAAPRINEGWQVSITHPAGALEIFRNWFEKEGVKLSIEKLTDKIDFAVKFTEKEAKKDEKFMIKSNFIKYTPVYKAVNNKEKEVK